MIAISGALVLVAIGLLVAGLVVPSFMLVYASIGMSLVAAVCLVVGVYVGRDQLFRRGGTAKKGKKTGKATAVGKSAAARKSGTKASTGSTGTKRVASTRAGARGGSGTKGVAAATLPADAEVVVVPGRPRYHLASCRQVKDRTTETKGLAAARGEDYVACTACRPDSVLAARGEAHSDANSGRRNGSPLGRHRAAGTVTVVSGGRRYHLPDCQVVLDAEQDGDELTTRPVEQARSDGLTPCTVCSPSSADD